MTEWLNQQDEVKVYWSGGHDEGSYTVVLNGEELPWENETAQTITAILDRVLQYESWAGDFSAYGEATWDREKEVFVGTNSQTQWTSQEIAISANGTRLVED